MDLKQLFERTAIKYDEFKDKLLAGNAAREIFEDNIAELATRIEETLATNSWQKRISQAEIELQRWAGPERRPQNYTPEELAKAQVSKEITKAYQKENSGVLRAANLFHDGLVRQTLEEDYAKRLIEIGSEGQKLTLIELSARLSPALTFPGSSKYFKTAFIPYDRNVRVALGEKEHERNEGYVNETTVIDSASSARNAFGPGLILAETSSAPEYRTTRSRKNPQLYVCELLDLGEPQVTHYETEVNTPFRESFDSQCREIMFKHLVKLIGE